MDKTCSAAATFRGTMTERRKHRRNSLDWHYLTRAARKCVWIMLGVPTSEWTE